MQHVDYPCKAHRIDRPKRVAVEIIDDFQRPGTAKVFERLRVGRLATCLRLPKRPAYTANTLNQYTAVGSASPTYDGNGNTTSDGTYSFGFDPENRLVSASGAGNTASYAFDGRGRRKSRTVNGTTTISITDAQNREVLDYDGSTGAILRWYAYGLGPNALLNQMNVAAGTRATLLPDQLGSIIGSMDSSTGALSSFAYRSYGASGAAPAQFGYTGQRVDAESGTYYYRARQYSPGWGRFLQADPIGYQGGMHLYAYVGNDPLNAFDPDGLLLESALNTAGDYASSCLENCYFTSYFTSSQQGLRPGLAGLLNACGPACDPGALYSIAAGLGQFAPAGDLDAAFFSGVRTIFGLDRLAPAAVTEGTTVYRVYGENNNPLGASWTRVNPNAVSNYRDAAGLPDVNTGRFVIEGTITDTRGVTTKSATPLNGNAGGLDEVVIPNAASQVRINNVSGANPPF